MLANIIGVPSQKFAIPFPVISRMTYGVFGSNIPALIRGIIAIVWYGIQTYLASAALMVVVLYEFPSLISYHESSYFGLSPLGWGCFLVMWLLQTALFLCRMEAIRRFMDWAGPIVYLAMLGLMVLIVGRAGWENISFTLSETEMFHKRLGRCCLEQRLLFPILQVRHSILVIFHGMRRLYRT